MATGIQEKFSWKAVGMAAIGGGVGAGLGVAAGLDKLGAVGSALKNSFIRGATSSAISQGIGVATGLQDKFSWAGVAAAGVGAFVGSQFSGLASTAASALANAATRSALDGSNFGDNIKAAIPDVIGQALGNALAGGISSGEGGRLSFNFNAAISDTVGLVAGLPQGIVDGLADMRTDVATTLSVLNAKAEAGFNENQAKTIAREHVRTQDKIDEIVTTAMRQRNYDNVLFMDRVTKSNQRIQSMNRTSAIYDNLWRDVYAVQARETRRSLAEDRLAESQRIAGLRGNGGVWAGRVDYANGVDMSAIGNGSFTLDQVQLMLDGAGFFPVLGIGADLINAGISLGRGNYGEALLNVAAAGPFLGDSLKAVNMGVKTTQAVAKHSDEVGDGVGVIGRNADEVVNSGRTGKQKRLREMMNDPNTSSADRGWLIQDQNAINRGQRKTLRVPPGKEMAHQRGREAAKGFGYEYSNLQDKSLHKLQHKYDDFGRKNKLRPPDE